MDTQEARAAKALFDVSGRLARVGLLLLRGAVSLIALSEGVSYLTGSGNPIGHSVAALLAISSGASLLLGFLTPAGSAIAALGCAGMLFGWFPAPAPNLIEVTLCAILVITVAIAIVLLGPGPYRLMPVCSDAGRSSSLARPIGGRRTSDTTNVVGSGPSTVLEGNYSIS